MNEVCINAEGTRMWLTDNALHQTGQFGENRSRIFVEINSNKLKKTIAKAYGLESWVVLPIK